MFDNDELAHLREADNCVSKGAVLEEANVALNDRICHLCDCVNVEDERHFLFSCSA